MDQSIQRIEQASVGMARAELDVEIATAHAFPRDIDRAISEATKMATINDEAASECHYSLPRGGKNIEGPSVRLAEIVASAYGNLRTGSRILEIGERDITVAGVAWDLQSNYKYQVEIKRRITDSKGKRYNDDLITLACNAAGAIAYRNAVLKVIPKGVWGTVAEAAKKKMLAPASTPSGLADMRGKALGHFAGLKITVEQVLTLLGVDKVEDIGLTELATMKGWAVSIKEGASISSIFSNGESSEGTKVVVPVEVPQKNGEDARRPLWNAWRQLSAHLSNEQRDVIFKELKVREIITTSPIEIIDQAITLAEQEIAPSVEEGV